ncbi:protein phosphatase 1 regulatory subunit 37 isoform X2 [Polypterus senegalus]|uniref:protein phosphatase 1 regulatory subunit 37 isoform X2 n=1 Tax=Polypterus senegalus TaxID=55291 RepID=UPI001964FC90|nr:protein phosphatase 1 regulatory subunit 37 isoform X2 [Polypterus senegalus]
MNWEEPKADLGNGNAIGKKDAALTGGLESSESQLGMDGNLVTFQVGGDDSGGVELGVLAEPGLVMEQIHEEEATKDTNGNSKSLVGHRSDTNSDMLLHNVLLGNHSEDHTFHQNDTGSVYGSTSDSPSLAEGDKDLTLQEADSSSAGSPKTEGTKVQGQPADTLSPCAQDQLVDCPAELGSSERLGLSPSQPSEDNEKLKHSAKRVTFPSDEQIVSGAVEPKDPWRHAQNVTVDEIVTAYKNACQKLNCKPIPKLLKQIQEFKDLTQRVDCLDLKGEKLDYKACEALEEIFKRVQFKVVDLEQTSLDEDGASALFDMIEYYESATHLNISFNKHIGTRGWQAAAHMMRKTNCLQYLDARNTPLLDHSAPFVARALRISSSLGVLHLENASLSGRPLMLLATALKMNVNLRELYLADNKLNGLQDSAQLGNLLKFNCYIQILDLRNNHILDSGLAYLCEGLKEQRKGLVTLVLWNNQLTHNSMTYLAAALPFTQSLETLNLGHNAIGNEGVHKLKDGLIANRSVLRLGLASTKLSCEGAVAVAEFIAESPRLLRLDLRENEIKTGGLMALSLALKVNTSLLRLDLDREPKKETVKSFIETQKALLSEIQNGCKRNFILAKEKEETEQKMRQSASMPEITMALPQAEEEAMSEESQQDIRDENTSSNEECDNEQSAAEEEEEEEDEEEEKEVECASKTQEQEDESDSDTDEENEEVEGSTQTNTEAQHQKAETVSELSAKMSEPVAEVRVESVALVANAAPSSNLEEKPVAILDTTSNQSSPLRNNERHISVSSPGRGHKIFVVTRVESPPEQMAAPAGLQTKPLFSQSSATLTVGAEVHSLTNSASHSEQVPPNALVTPRRSNCEEKCEMAETTSCTTMEGMPLPNGLKTEFALLLSDPSDIPKTASCGTEHELSCSKNDKEIEEMLLEASLEAGKEAQ